MKFKHILCAVMVFQLSTLSLAAVSDIQKKENKIVEKYKNSNFYEINADFMERATQLINANKSASFKYDFPAFKDSLNLSIHYPTDHQFKVYTFDVGGGGTMGEFESYTQFQNQLKTKIAKLDTGYVQKIDQVTLNKAPVYLVHSYYKGSSCIGAYSIQAFKANNHKLIKANIFQTKSKALNEISVDYDCHNDSAEDVQYIQLSKDKKILNIQFLDADGRPQPKQIRYVLKPNGYVYQGIYKK